MARAARRREWKTGGIFHILCKLFPRRKYRGQLKRGKRGGAGATSGIHFESVLHRLGIAVFEKTLFAPSGYDPSRAVVAAMHTGLRILVSFDSISAAVFDVL